MKSKLTIAVLILGGLALADRLPLICKVSHIGTNAAAVTCTNGADPTGTKIGVVLLVSCGK